jgi:hypothetical protein
MIKKNGSHSKLRALSGVTLLVACNGLLDNDRRLWDPADTKGGESGEGTGGTFNAGGKKSGAGSSGAGAQNEAGADDGSGGTGGTSDPAAGEGGEAGTTGGTGNAGQSSGGQSGGGHTSGGQSTGGQSSGGQSGAGQSSAGQTNAGTGGTSCVTEPNACMPGATDSENVACGACGAGMATRMRTCQSDCTWGDWSEPSACQITVACEPGQVATQMENCGACMTGTRARSRTCTDACAWGEWGAFGQCTGVTAACTAGATENRSVACPCSGTKTQRRTCSSSCAWGGWTDTSSCNLECCSEIVYCNTPNDISPASRGTWCRRTDADCTNAQVSSDCMEDITMVCGSVVPTLYIEY